MSESDRIRDTKALSWVFPTVGILLAILLAWGIGYLQARDAERRYYTPRQYQESAKAQAQRACSGMKTTAMFECVDEHVEAAYQQANAEQDLSAQQRAALSSLAAAIVSALALIATGIGVYYVRETLRATVKAVEDTSRATEAMQEANRIAKVGIEQQLRPWLSIELLNSPRIVIVNKSPQIYIQAEIRNMGQTPAIDISWSPDLCIGYEPHISAHIAYKNRRKDVIGLDGDIFQGGKMFVEGDIFHEGEAYGEEIGFITIMVFYKTTFSKEDRVTGLFFKMWDTTRNDGLVDFSRPLDYKYLKLIPWNQMPGIIE